jgi:predicted HicB family RNase H-like nuclease|tara:strand:- start:1010 stop:1210 length:201 start_codon:yes stop_codon:yes gene_type:complete
MIDIDEYIEMWNDKLLGSVGVNELMRALIAEVKRLLLVEMSVQDFLDEKIDSLEFCRNMRDMGVIE